MATATKKTAAKSATKKPAAKTATKPATKKPAAKTATKPAAKKSATKTTAKPVAKKPVEKVAPKKQEKDIYNTEVSVLLACAVGALMLLLAYLIIIK